MIHSNYLPLLRNKYIHFINLRYMKKLTLLAIIIFFIGLTSAFAQTPVVNPIPSFNFPMNEPLAVFHEGKIKSANREKREMDVMVTTRSTNMGSIYATVYVFKIKPNKILGPFIVFSGDELEVPIDNSKWGVTVECSDPIDVSVWTD